MVSAGLGALAALYLASRYGVSPELAALGVGTAGAVVTGAAGVIGSAARDEVHERGQRHGFGRRVLFGLLSKLG